MDSFERILWWLFAGSSGSSTRGAIVKAIREEPRNAQKLSEALNLDYTTVRHHLRVLQENKLIISEGEKYGKLYFVTESMEAHWSKLEEILKRSHAREGVRSR
ncbi:MAG TPA: winged helix-turn-helix domain-containing protein [Nitrososphaerales archaeon]|nr:winged helix-turn-helix domain-containing protein [Nitrososphaerales archaeon]